MIVEVLMGLGHMLFDRVIGFLPRVSEQEGMLITSMNWFTSLIWGMNSLGVWIPWSHIASALAAVSSFYFMSLSFRVLRAVAGHLPFVGGNG